jgi:hypothetical protein
MNKIKSALVKVIATWSAIGAGLIGLGLAGIPIPDQFLELFSQNVADALQSVVDAGFMFYGTIVSLAQIVRTIFIAKEEDGGEVSTRNLSDIKKISWSPFKV